jgi:hypothetical protein
MFYLTPPRHISTLQILLRKSFCGTEDEFFEPYTRLGAGGLDGEQAVGQRGRWLKCDFS